MVLHAVFLLCLCNLNKNQRTFESTWNMKLNEKTVEKFQKNVKLRKRRKQGRFCLLSGYILLRSLSAPTYILTLCKYFLISLSHTTPKQPARQRDRACSLSHRRGKRSANNESNCFIHDVPVSENEQKRNAEKHHVIKGEPKMKKEWSVNKTKNSSANSWRVLFFELCQIPSAKAENLFVLCAWFR